MGSETTAAAMSKEGVLRRDPMAMLPFCGYNMGDYFGHWLKMGKKMKSPPKIFFVNWFRQDEHGKFMWPGFGDNIRVLKWMLDRIKGKVGVNSTPIGLTPNVDDLDLKGLDIPRERMEKLFEVKLPEWKAELESVKTFLRQFEARMPDEIWEEFKKLEAQAK
jgi:phosphoenolpyruvate carboxykinase (GTP)